MSRDVRECMCFGLDGDEGDGGGAYGSFGLIWLHSTPQLFDDSTSKTASRHRDWFIFNHGRSKHIRPNRSRGVLYIKHVLGPSQVDRKDDDEKNAKGKKMCINKTMKFLNA